MGVDIDFHQYDSSLLLSPLSKVGFEKGLAGGCSDERSQLERPHTETVFEKDQH